MTLHPDQEISSSIESFKGSVGKFTAEFVFLHTVSTDSFLESAKLHVPWEYKVEEPIPERLFHGLHFAHLFLHAVIVFDIRHVLV